MKFYETHNMTTGFVMTVMSIPANERNGWKRDMPEMVCSPHGTRHKNKLHPLW